MIEEEFLVACPNLEDEIRGKWVLNFGSGCTGALRSFTGAALKIEMDPLIDRYVNDEFATVRRTENTILLKGYGERIPVSDQCIDVIVSCNSLDHVDSLEDSAKEIDRVLKPGGILVLVVDVKAYKTACEPSPIENAETIRDLFPGFQMEHDEIKDIPKYEEFLTSETTERPTLYCRLRK